MFLRRSLASLARAYRLLFFVGTFGGLAPGPPPPPYQNAGYASAFPTVLRLAQSDSVPWLRGSVYRCMFVCVLVTLCFCSCVNMSVNGVRQNTDMRIVYISCNRCYIIYMLLLSSWRIKIHHL